MVRDSARHHSTTATTTGVLLRVGGQVRQFICGLYGHDSLLHFEKGRLSLLCSSCGYETPGWDVKNTPIVQSPAAAAKRRVIRLPILGERRLA
jgi:hypothetical protein